LGLDVPLHLQQTADKMNEAPAVHHASLRGSVMAAGEWSLCLVIPNIAYNVAALQINPDNSARFRHCPAGHAGRMRHLPS
jgi:hypothetical protein